MTGILTGSAREARRDRSAVTGMFQERVGSTSSHTPLGLSEASPCTGAVGTHALAHLGCHGARKT